MVGPITGAMMIGTPMALITRAMSAGPAFLTRIIWPIGRIIPPPTPWKTRKAMSSPGWWPGRTGPSRR